ncbi:MAG: response regulator [Planctomycetota bacterium]
MSSRSPEPPSDPDRPLGAPSGSAGGGARMRVLIADDDERSLDAIVALFDRERFSIDPAHGGLEALARLGLPDGGAEVEEPGEESAGLPRMGAVSLPYDFMVLDYNMPDLTGVEVMRRIRIRFGGPLPAIMVSGNYSSELLRSWSSVGGFSLLPKPIEPVDFRNQVNLLVQRFFGGATA